MSSRGAVLWAARLTKLLSQKPSQPEQQRPHPYAAVFDNTPQPPLNLTPNDQKLSLFSSPPPSSAAPSSTTPPLLPNPRSSMPTTSPLTQLLLTKPSRPHHSSSQSRLSTTTLRYHISLPAHLHGATPSGPSSSSSLKSKSPATTRHYRLLTARTLQMEASDSTCAP